MCGKETFGNTDLTIVVSGDFSAQGSEVEETIRLQSTPREALQRCRYAEEYRTKELPVKKAFCHLAVRCGEGSNATPFIFSLFLCFSPYLSLGLCTYSFVTIFITYSSTLCYFPPFPYYYFSLLFLYSYSLYYSFPLFLSLYSIPISLFPVSLFFIYYFSSLC